MIGFLTRLDNLHVERLTMPESLEVDEEKLADTSGYPITVTLKKLPPPKDWGNGDVKSGLYRSNLFAPEEAKPNGVNGHNDEVETIQCKYVVGCDGARSWVRKYIEATHYLI